MDINVNRAQFLRRGAAGSLALVAGDSVLGAVTGVSRRVRPGRQRHRHREARRHRRAARDRLLHEGDRREEVQRRREGLPAPGAPERARPLRGARQGARQRGAEGPEVQLPERRRSPAASGSRRSASRSRPRSSAPISVRCRCSPATSSRASPRRSPSARASTSPCSPTSRSASRSGRRSPRPSAPPPPRRRSRRSSRTAPRPGSVPGPLSRLLRRPRAQLRQRVDRARALDLPPAVGPQLEVQVRARTRRRCGRRGRARSPAATCSPGLTFAEPAWQWAKNMSRPSSACRTM